MKQCPSSGRRNRLIQQEMASAGVEGGWAEEGSEKAFGGGLLELPGWRHLVICRGRGWGCFRRGSSLTKGLERGRQGATSNSTWLGRARNEWNPQSGTVSCSVHYLSPTPPHLQNTLLPIPRCRETVKEMTWVLQTQHSHPPSATGFLVQRPLHGYISSASARRLLHLLSRKERKNIPLRAFFKDFFFFFF